MPYSYLGTRVGVQIDYITAAGAYSLRTVSNSVSQLALTNVDNPEQMKGIVANLGFKGFYLSYDSKERSPLDGTHKLFKDTGFPGHSTNQDETVLLFNFGNDTVATNEILTLIFDVEANEYPTHISIDPVYFFDGDYDISYDNIFATLTNVSPLIKVTIPELNSYHSEGLDQPCNGVVITLSNNSNARAPIKVTHCDISLSIYHKDDTVYSVKQSKQLFNAEYTFNPGILQQYADIVLKDKSSIFSLLASQDMLVENLKAGIDVQVRGGSPDPAVWYSFYVDYLIYVTRNWTMSSNNHDVSLSCKDASESFDNIEAPYVSNLPATLGDLLVATFVALGHNITYDLDTSMWLSSIKLDTTQSLQPESFGNRIQNICNAGLLTIYWSANEESFRARRCY